MIRKYSQGSSRSDRELFGFVGVLAVSKEVHDELGVPVTSEPGDIWLVARRGNRAIGFSQMRQRKNGEVHLRYLYSENLSVRRALLRTAISTSRSMRSPGIYTNGRKTDRLWKSLGFKVSGGASGSFVRWEMCHEKK